MQLRSRISLTIKVSVDSVINYDLNSITFKEVVDAIRVGRALMDMSMPFVRDMNKINIRGGIVTCDLPDNSNQLILTIYNEKGYF